MTTPEIKFHHQNPYIPSPVHKTEQGTPYLQHAGVALLARTVTDIDTMADFLSGFDSELGFGKYLHDTPIHHGAQIAKTAGQLCYMSFSEKRTKNADAQKYLDHIKAEKHGTVLEHCSFSLLLYGTSRSQTHEIVRHRTLTFSQVSQRYVDGKTLRFVERPEYQKNDILHKAFERRIETADASYVGVADFLAKSFENDPAFAVLSRTDQRKHVNQAARSVLPNETEAPIVVTGNTRAWRHFLEMRCAASAEVEIRDTAFRVYLCLNAIEPMLFNDYEVKTLGDGTVALETAYRKV